MVMKCRRCLEPLIFNGEDADSEEIAKSLGSPHSVVYVVGAGHPTVLCLDCYDELYLVLKEERVKFEWLDDQMSILKDRLRIEEVVELSENITRAAIEWNSAIIKWVQKGKDGVCTSK